MCVLLCFVVRFEKLTKFVKFLLYCLSFFCFVRLEVHDFYLFVTFSNIFLYILHRYCKYVYVKVYERGL